MRLRAKDIRAAESTKYLAKIPPTGNPEQDLKTVMDSIGSKGWSLVERGENNPWADWTTTFHRRIALSHGFYEQPVWEQDDTLWHEDVHIEQRVDIGRHRFNVRYMGNQRCRLIYETHAYRVSVQKLKARGASGEQIDAYISHVIKILRYKYRITLLRKKGARKEIRRILKLGATDWT
jgi:hypothetical protein